MANGPTLPPQAYTREILTSAFNWLQSQPESVKKLATTPDALVGLFMRAQRFGASSLEADAPVSSQNFMSDLKNLAEGLKQFEGPKERRMFQTESSGPVATVQPPSAQTSSSAIAAAAAAAVAASVQSAQAAAQKSATFASHSMIGAGSATSNSAQTTAQQIQQLQQLHQLQQTVQQTMHATPTMASPMAPQPPTTFTPRAPQASAPPLFDEESLSSSVASTHNNPNAGFTASAQMASANHSASYMNLNMTAPITSDSYAYMHTQTPAPPAPVPQVPIQGPTQGMMLSGGLSERSLQMIREVKAQLNLSTEAEAINMMLSIAYKNLKDLLV